MPISPEKSEDACDVLVEQCDEDLMEPMSGELEAELLEVPLHANTNRAAEDLAGAGDGFTEFVEASSDRPGSA